MAQGTRGRWVRTIVAGLGVTFSTGLVGCMNWDKPKDTKSTTPPKAGLPGTPTLPAGGNGGIAGQPKWQVPGAGQYTGPGGNIQPNNNFATGAPARTGTNGLTTTAGGTNQNYGNWPPTGSPGTVGTPGVPGANSIQPIGGFGPVGAAPLQPSGGAVAGYGPTSPLPSPSDLTILPPAPPTSPGGEFAGTGSVLPPNVGSGLGPVAPPASPPVGGAGVGVFGSR